MQRTRDGSRRIAPDFWTAAKNMTRVERQSGTRRRYFDGWKFDLARACLVCGLYIAFVAFGMSHSFLYGGGFAGTFPLLAALFLGPWPAAWITCKLMPSQRRRIGRRLASGIYVGYFACWMLLALTYGLLPKWPDNDPRTRFMARHDAALVIIPFCFFFVVGPFVLSRWRRSALSA
jgi:hypothetical protein